MSGHSLIRHARGTVISDDAPEGPMSTVFVRKQGQILISVLPKDLSFVMGDNLASLFHILACSRSKGQPRSGRRCKHKHLC